MKAARLALKNNTFVFPKTALRLSSNIIWCIVAEVGGKGLLFLSMLFLARVLDTENFGLYNFAFTLVTYFWIAGDLGTNMYGVRTVATNKENKRQILSSLLSLRIAGGLTVFSLFNGLLFFFSRSPLQRLVFFYFSFYLLCRPFFAEWYLRGLERFRSIAVVNLVTYGAFLVLLSLLVTNKTDVAHAAILWPTSIFLGGLLFLALASHDNQGLRLQFSATSCLPHLRNSVHFVFSGGLSTLYQTLPILLLGLFGSHRDVGLYSSAHRIIFGAIFVLSALPLAVYPVLSEFQKNNRAAFIKLIRLSFQFTVLIAFFASSAIFLFSLEMVSALYGHQYAKAELVVRILAAFVFLRVIREMLIIALSSTGLQRIYSLGSAFSVAFIIVLFFSLYRFIDMLVLAPLSLVITEFFVLVIMLCCAKAQKS